MGFTFKVWRDPYDAYFNTCEKTEIELKEGLTVLVGCNGAGKTTLLQNIEEEVKKNKYSLWTFDNFSEGGHNNANWALWNNNIDLCATSMCASEGENITISINRIAYKLKEFIEKGEKAYEKNEWDFLQLFGGIKHLTVGNGNKRFLLLDAIDSGYSIDNVVDLKNMLYQVIDFAKDNDKELYIILSANEYELANGENCIDVISGDYVQFKDYEDYKKLILNTRKKKNKRMETSAKKLQQRQERDENKLKKFIDNYLETHNEDKYSVSIRSMYEKYERKYPDRLSYYEFDKFFKKYRKEKETT